MSGGQTQRIHSQDLPSVRETHLEEQELVDYENRALDTDAEDAVRAHLDTCAGCRQRLEQLHQDDGTGATKVRDPMVGRQLGEYRVEGALARGGMGVVYRGVQPMIGKQVAIKVLIPEAGGDGIDRLLEEARAVNAIRHPNIIDIFSFGSLPDGRHYFVMELLDGKSLDDLLQEQRMLTADQVMTVLEQSCSALGAAHASGVIHRDLKPANLFVGTLPDGTWHVTVLDFGLAKRLGNTRKTSTNIVMGTPGFMAPEQIRGKGAVPQTDLYAMGVVAWVALTATEPFEGEGIIDLMRAHLEQPLPSLANRAPRTPPALVALIERMLAKDPADRPQSAMEVLAEVKRIRTLPANAAASGPLMRQPAVRSDRRAALAPAGMPSAELVEAIAPTNAGHQALGNDLASSPTRVSPSLRNRARATGPEASDTTNDEPVLKGRRAPASDAAHVSSDTAHDEPALTTRRGTDATTNDLQQVAAPNRLPLIIGGFVVALVVGLGGWLALRSPPQVDPKPVEPPVEDVKPVAPTPVEVKPVEPPPVEVKPVEPTPPPVEVKPEPKPVEVKPVRPPPTPRPPALTAEKVVKSLNDTRAKGEKLPPGQKRLLGRQLDELLQLLKTGKSPAAVQRELDDVRDQFGLK